MTIAFTARSLVQHFEDVGDYKKAEELLLDIVAAKELEFGSKSASVAEDLYELGLVYLASNEFVKADKLLNRALEIQVKELGHNHVDTKETKKVLRELQTERVDYLNQAS